MNINIFNFFLKIINKLHQYYVETLLFFFKNRDSKQIFTLIYKTKYWSTPFSKKSVSGRGSDLDTTKNIIKNLEKFFKDYEIKSILDIPCGDFNWFQKINLNKLRYIGADIVKEIVKSNLKKYKTDNINFLELDVVNDDLPSVDIIFVRDCFIHLSNEDIIKSIENIKKSESKYFATTNFLIDKNINQNINSGEFRFINLQKPPFLLSNPFISLNDSFESQNENYHKKFISIWKTSDL